MKFLILNIIIVLEIVFPSFLFSQEPSYYQYETSNGLPSNEVYDIKQDKLGFLWFGTEAGLVRYDGNEFKLFLCEKSRSNALSYLCEDQFGRMWCSNFSGQILYFEKDTLHLFEPFEKHYKTGLTGIAIDNKNRLYAANQSNSMYRYDIGSKKEELLFSANEYKSNPYTACDGKVVFSALDNKNLKKIVDDREIPISVELENGSFNTRVFYNSVVFSNSYSEKKSFAFQRFNLANQMPIIYTYTNKALMIHPISKHIQKTKDYPQSVFDDDAGNFFVGTTNGLLWFKQNAGNWVFKCRLLDGNSVTSIKKDKEGTYWMATAKNGIYKIPNLNIFQLDFESLDVKSIGINHLATDEKSILCGANLAGEIIMYDVKNCLSKKIIGKENRYVQALEYNSKSNEFWLSQYKTYSFNPLLCKLKESSSFLTNTKSFYFRSDGVLFTQSTTAQANFIKRNPVLEQKVLKEFKQLINPIFIDSSKDFKRVLIGLQRGKAIYYQEKLKVLWVGFVDGVAYYENQIPIKLIDEKSNSPIIANQFLETSNHSLLIATVNQGLYLVEGKKIIKHITTQNGLSSNNIKRACFVNNIVWMIAGKNVDAFDLKQSKIISTINMQDGLLSNELSDIVLLRDTVYVASSKGIQYFPKNISTTNSIEPVCLINSFKVDDILYNFQNEISLENTVKNISINLQAIAIKSNGDFKYQYRLLPTDTNWITVSSKENEIRFSSLSYGNYTFDARVMNEDGVVNSNKTSVNFIVNKPWWLKWWAIVLYLTVITTASFLFYNFRLRKQQQKLKTALEKSIVEEALRKSQLVSLKAQMNPHFMFNALNSIQEFIILNDKQQANIYLGKFADLMRMILDMSNKDLVSFDNELVSLKLYLELEALRFESQFSYHITVDESVNSIGIYMPPMLIQPYVENAVKHGLLHKKGNKELSIIFSMSNTNILTCIITDNGIGRQRSMEINQLQQKKHISFATGATQKRLELLNVQHSANISVAYNDLVDSRGNSTGTKVIINIPIQ